MLKWISADIGGGLRMCSQEVRRMEVIRLVGDRANPHNRMKRIGYADWCLCGEEKTKR